MDNLALDILVLKILIFGLFAVLVLWLLIMLLRQDSRAEESPEIYTVKDGRVLIYKLEEWREAQKSAN